LGRDSQDVDFEDIRIFTKSGVVYKDILMDSKKTFKTI
jgi:hypothetical protein